MALEAKLSLENKMYIVQDLDYEITQPISNNYKPSGIPEGGLINFTIISPKREDNTFYKWILNIGEKKEGYFKIPIIENNIEHREKELCFEYAYCIGLREVFSCSNGLQTYMHITICAAYIGWGSYSDRVWFTNRGLTKRIK